MVTTMVELPVFSRTRYAFNVNIMTGDGMIPCYGLMDPNPIIKILIDYPLTRPSTFEVKCPNPEGWTEVEFLDAVHAAYRAVYSLEDDSGRAGNLYNLGKSDGPVGIWGHDIGDLYLEGAIKRTDGTWELEV